MAQSFIHHKHVDMHPTK